MKTSGKERLISCEKAPVLRPSGGEMPASVGRCDFGAAPVSGLRAEVREPPSASEVFRQRLEFFLEFGIGEPFGNRAESAGRFDDLF